MLTPLGRASELGLYTIVDLLIKNGADVEAAGEQITPLILAVTNSHSTTTKILISAGANTNFSDDSCWTAYIMQLHMATLEVIVWVFA